MWYDKKHTQVLDPKTWYDKIYKEYKQHHNFLEGFDKNFWQRFIPRKLEWKTIIDLWCWDGRISNFFTWKSINKYIWIDISENMLKNTRPYVEKIQSDLNQDIPLKDESWDIIISLFTLLHIDNIENFLKECYRTLKEDWAFILFHHIERKNYIYEKWKERFKIKTNKWSYKQIENLLEYSFFKFNIYDIKENNVIIWKYFICKKEKNDPIFNEIL